MQSGSVPFSACCQELCCASKADKHCAKHTLACSICHICPSLSRSQQATNCTQPLVQYITQGLAAGKHVLSEKPIAATLSRATEMLQAWQKLQPRPVWSVAENFRFEDGVAAMAAKTPQLGKLLKVDYVADMGFRAGNQCALRSMAACARLQQHVHARATRTPPGNMLHARLRDGALW